MAHDLQYQAAANPYFQSRVYMSMLSAAIAIAAEATATPNHVNRVAFAKQVTGSVPTAFQNQGQTLAWAAAITSQGLDNTATDAAIDTAVSSIWNAWAGVT
jgi:hypothetical protein